jgi:hypothetical protein
MSEVGEAGLGAASRPISNMLGQVDVGLMPNYQIGRPDWKSLPNIDKK